MREQALLKFWGKADTRHTPAWHPLAYHCLDVAACGLVLLECRPAWRKIMAEQSGIDGNKITSWTLFLLAIHDIGKFGDGFQTLPSNPFGSEVKVAYQARHDTLGFALTAEYLPAWLSREPHNDMELDLLLPWLAAVTGHHGRPPKNSSMQALLRAQFPTSVRQIAHDFVDMLQRLLLPDGWALPEPDHGVAERQQRASWQVAGLAVLADWLGSNTRWFKYHLTNLGIADYWERVALPCAEQAIKESGLFTTHPARAAGFADLFPHIHTPTPLQTWADRIIIAPGPQLFVLEDLTGGGKTEAALTLAARLMAAGQGDGVYFALPTMATADAMFRRMRKQEEDGGPATWRRFFGSGNPSLVLAHSAAKTAQKLDLLKDQNDGGYDPSDEEASASQHSSAWLADSRKKALLADFGVGTIDQALLAVMKLRHQSLRLLGLATKLLVVDEVHACDCYMGELLTRLLHFHAAQGGSAILLSATLPLAQRRRLLAAFAYGAGFHSGLPVDEGYPLATHLHGAAARPDETPLSPRNEASRNVLIEPLQDEAAVFQRLHATLARGGCAVWIRNTVVDAIAAWKSWTVGDPGRSKYPVTLFHARFTLGDRLAIGDGVLTAFGEESTQETRKGHLVIATQVVEQSLDVDFDDMVTDLAPIDLVIQRAGRLQRHKRDAQGNRAEVEARGGARLGVLMPAPSPDAAKDWYSRLLPKAARVYSDHGRLWLTADWLAKGGFDLSRHARAMIEAVYGETGYERVPEGLKRSSDSRQGACSSERTLARQNLLAFDTGYDATSNQWPDEDAYTDIPTRLGEPTVRLRLGRIGAENRLLPWTRVDPDIDWALSELTVPKRLIARESLRHSALLKQARMEMVDEGRYCLIIPLEPHGSAWRSWAEDMEGKTICVYYSPISGLSIEHRETRDESDL